MQHGGTLFSALPYSTMVRPGGYRSWRKNQLLPAHTLLAVVTLPGDLFYPVGVTSVGIFIRKGVPHARGSNVLWVRALNDGLLKSKGKRLPHPRATDDLAKVKDTLRAFLDNPGMSVAGVNQFVTSAPIDFDDKQVELVPEAYLGQAEPAHESVANGMEESIRNMLAHLVKIGKAKLLAGLIRPPEKSNAKPTAWKRFVVTDFFDLLRGHFHSIADLDTGTHPTVSRAGTDNGLVGFFEKPEKAKVFEPGMISVSTVTGDAFVPPVPFIATDNVVLCRPKEAYKDMGWEWRFFVQLMINEVKWRYSYGRQCYKTKFAKTEIVLPVTRAGTLDTDYMAAVVRGTPHWPLVEHVMDKGDQ